MKIRAKLNVKEEMEILNEGKNIATLNVREVKHSLGELVIQWIKTIERRSETF